MEKDVHLLLEPSCTKLQALVVHVDAPGILDLSQLEFQLSFSTSSSHHQMVEYAVVPIEFVQSTTDTIGYGECNPSGCDFTLETDWIVEMGIGMKTTGTNDTYQWCYENDRINPRQKGRMIRHSNETETHVLRYEMVGVFRDNQKNSIDRPIDGKLSIEDSRESGYYAILFANCIGQRAIQVDGTLVWNTRQQITGPSFTQAIFAPLLLVGILAVVFYVKEKEGRSLFLEDAYNASARNAGYSSLPMMDLSSMNR